MVLLFFLERIKRIRLLKVFLKAYEGHRCGRAATLPVLSCYTCFNPASIGGEKEPVISLISGLVNRERKAVNKERGKGIKEECESLASAFNQN